MKHILATLKKMIKNNRVKLCQRKNNVMEFDVDVNKKSSLAFYPQNNKFIFLGTKKYIIFSEISES